jgi:predicted O-linked N-acetylglucosamine transferase (SPINDLY family)
MPMRDPMTSESIKAVIERALQHHGRGELRDAEAIYLQVLQNDPSNPDALHLLGVIAYQKGNTEPAVELIRRAIAENPAIPEYYINLGNGLRSLGRLDDAEFAFRQALKLDPRAPEAHHNLGLALRDQGKAEEAIRCFRKALKARPDLPDAHNGLGLSLLDMGKSEDAIRCFRQALRLRPAYAEAHCNLGSALRIQGNIRDSLHHVGEALRLSPGLAEAHCNLGALHRDEGRLDEAIASYGEALRLNPSLADTYVNLGSLLHDSGLHREAAEHYAGALKLKPGHLAAGMGMCMAQLEVLYDTAEDILTSRERYRTQLENLVEGLRLDSPARIETASRVVGGAQPFYLAYQGEVDCDLQRTYGELVCRIQSSRFPRWSKRPPMPPVVSGAPLRVGIVSGYFCNHSNWKIPIKGWIQNLDPRRIALYGYHTGGKKDGETGVARSAFVRFDEEPASIERLCQTILADRLHILIYPEVGMDRLAVRLAALRLAPVQCVSWGHPDTSGLPSMDYYLSSELMEPPDADEHYSEKLIRLPNLSIHYIPPEIRPACIDRAGLGLRENSVLYFCAQSLFKYLPQHDDLFPRIALAVSNCQFVFLQYAKNRQINERFSARLARAFARHGLAADDYVALLPPQDPPHYQALNRIADVFLDSIGWSGCNSTLEAVAFGLPVVTLPGRLMRGRHSFAILKMMGIEDGIASSIEDYVSKAALLGKAVEWRRQIAGRIRENAHRVYRDLSCIRALEEFLEGVVVSGSAP